MRQTQPNLFRSSLWLLAHVMICSVVIFGGPISSRVLAAGSNVAVSIDEVEIGFAGAHKAGFWTPVWVTVSASENATAGQLEITSLDGRGLDVRSAGLSDVSVPATQTVTLLRYVKIGRLEKGLTVEFHGHDQPVVRKHVSYGDRPKAAIPDAEIVVSIGGDIGVAKALSYDPSALNVTAVHVQRADRLPLDWFGYEGVDTIVLTTYENKLLHELSLPQADAIRQWVEMGGQLVMCMGESGEQKLVAPLAELVPGTFDRIMTISNSAPLENYTGGGQALQITTERRLSMTALEDVRGNLELFDVGVNGRRPMIIRAPFGFGQVVFVAFDLDRPPLSEWAGRPRMVVKIIRGEFAQENRIAEQQRSGQVTHVGYHDMVGQLRGALDQFEGVSFVAFSVVATLILVYIVLIGPVDFFFLKNVIGKMQLTWITFPLIVVAFIALALLLKSRLKDDKILVNQVDLIDVDVDRSLLRGTTWAHIFSPVTETYDVTLRPAVTRGDDAAIQNLLSWQGMPGAGLGGLSSTAKASTFSEAYVLTAGQVDPVIAGLPIQVGSTTSVSSRWSQRGKWEQTTTLTADADSLLHGTVVNPLDVELHDCMVFYSVWAYHLERTRGRLTPGQTARPEDERPRNLEWRLTRRAVEEMKDIATPWDPASFDVPRIMEMMMFRGVAGGNQYTKLSHRYQDYVDISSHLNMGRAVLVGRIDERGSTLAVDGKTIEPDAGRHWTFCRIVFPVDRLNLSE